MLNPDFGFVKCQAEDNHFSLLLMKGLVVCGVKCGE
jgi:hypothetical protein